MFTFVSAASEVAGNEFAELNMMFGVLNLTKTPEGGGMVILTKNSEIMYLFVCLKLMPCTLLEDVL